MMKTKIAFWMLAAFAAFSTFGATTPMASQPWVRMTVSNAVDETKQWTKDYIKWGGESPEVVKGEGMAWFDGGTNLCYMRNGVVRTIKVKSSRTGRQTAGFLVLNCFNVSSVSNGMTFAWVGGKDFKCATSKGIPIITEVNPQTNEVDGVEYVYRKFKITETIETSPGYYTTVEWNTVQVSPSVWKCYRTGGADEGYEYKEFYLRECSVSATEGTPEEPRASLGFFGTLAELIFPSCRADGIDVVGGGGSYSLVIELDGQNPAYFTLSFKGHAKPLLPDPPKEDWEEEKGDKKIIHHYKWNPNPAFTKEDWCNPNLWIDSIYIVEIKVENPFSPTGYDIDYFRITGGGVLNYIGSAFASELANSYIEPEIVEWTEEEDLECKDGIHEFASNNDTCICNRCGRYNRHHHMVNVSGDCMKCDKPHGKEKENGTMVSSYGGKCGGREKGRAYHRGWKAKPFTEMGSPYPNGRGNTMSCTCLCGYYIDKDDMKHKFGDYERIYAGDEYGRDPNDVHTKVYRCEYCGGNPNGYGWSASVEAHKIDPNKSGQELSPECFISDKEAVKVTPPTRYPDDREQPADLSWHMAIGECDECEEEVETYYSPHVFQNCVCKCGMESHRFENINCPNAAHCAACNKWFYRDNDGYVHLDNENLDEHLFGGEQSQIWNGDVPDLVKHICHCGKRTQGDTDKSYQQHHWSEDDDDEKYCCDPDTPTKDGNNNWIRGCGIKYHTQETCPMNQAIGDCEGGWSCLICGRDLNVDKDGNPAPSVHGNINHGKPGSDSAKPHYGSQTIEDVFHCAVCKHTWLGAQCGTTLETTTDDKGHIRHKKKYVGTVLTDPQLHIGWRESTDSGRFYHDCKCRQLKEDVYGGCHRSHNWGSMTCEQISGDLYNHRTTRYCNYHDYQGTPTFDNCVRLDGKGVFKDTFIEGHAWRNNTSGRLYTSDIDGYCKKNVICRVYDSYGSDIGCHMTKREDAVHDWHILSWFGFPDVYRCGTGSDSERKKCYMTERCEHGPKDKAMTNERLGCGAQRNDGYHVRHEYTYSPSTYIDKMSHATHVNCANNCGLYEVRTNNHNHAKTGFTNITSVTHTKYTLCLKDFTTENPGCGHRFDENPEKHNRTLKGWKPDGNDYHESDLWCDICLHVFGTTNEHHQGWYNPGYADSYEYIGKIAMPAGDTMAHHKRNAICYKCSPYGFMYTVDEICEYDWVGGWKCNDDKDYDEGTCLWCGGKTMFQHELRPNYFLANEGHSCYHTYMNNIITGSIHFEDVHEDKPVCDVCGWERGESTECGGCSCCKLVNGNVRGCQVWDWVNHHCGCEYCSEGKGLSCVCGGMAKTLKFTFPFVLEGEFFRAFVMSGYVDVDMEDPVYEVSSNGFGEAFVDSQYIGNVNCGAITNVHECGFMKSFASCMSLTNANFGKMVKAGECAFASAFSNCTSLANINLQSMKEVGTNCFKGAFSYCSNLESVGLDSVEHIERGGFEYAFVNTGVESISVNNAKVIGERSFYGCEDLKEINLSSVTKIGEYAFANCNGLLAVNFTNDEEIPTLSNVNAFPDSRDLRIVVPESLYDKWIATNVWREISSMIIPKHQYVPRDDWSVELNGVPAGTTFAPQTTIVKEGETMTWDWGDGTVVSNLTSSPQPHTYAYGGNFRIFITNAVAICGNDNFNWMGESVYTGEEERHFIRRVKFSSDMKDIGYNAFVAEDGMVSCQAISVTNVGERAFMACERMDVANFPNAMKVGENAFYQSGIVCANLNNVKDEIGEYAFAYCKKLNRVYIPNMTKTSIGMFRESGIGFVSLENVKIVDSGSFYSCSNLTSFTLPNVEIICESAFNNTPISSVAIPSLKGFEGSGAFESCENMNYVYLPSITNGTSFRNCKNLSNVRIPNSMKDVSKFSFYRCKSLKAIPNAIRDAWEIPSSCFGECDSLTEVTLPNATNLNGRCFELSGITSVSIPNAIVLDDAFLACTNLVSVNAPNVEELKYNPFAVCKSLTELDLPKCVKLGFRSGVGLKDFTNTPLTRLGLGSLTVEQVKSMPNYPFDLQDGCVIECLDGTITVR